MVCFVAEGAKISSECGRQLRIDQKRTPYAVLMMG